MSMIVSTVMIHVDPGHIHDFVAATIKNHAESIREKGNLRFDILHSDNDPSKFMLYEAYESEEAAAAHKLTGHYTTWRDTVSPWMAEPRQAFKYTAVRP
jgi:autoinducer 2-degrading protein